jgi:hypothetical protein
MLGHLGMTVDDCITEYKGLSKELFSGKGMLNESLFWVQTIFTSKVQPRYGNNKLETVVKRLIGKKYGNGNAEQRLLDPSKTLQCHM